MNNDFLIWLQQNPWIFVGLVITAMLALYASRNGFYRAFRKSAQLIASSLKMQSRTLIKVVEQMRLRNRDVLLEMGRIDEERKIEREFFRVNAIVDRDLSGYPELQNVISQQITKIEEDYQNSGESPAPSPDWVEAVEAVSGLKEAQKGNPVIGKILEDLHESVVEQHKKSLGDYRESVAQRHRLLHGMMPYWRKLNNAVASVGETIKGLVKISATIDRHMDQYADIMAGSEKAERKLKMSQMGQFVLSSFIIFLVAGGIFMNFQFIALPMSEMVAGSSDRFSFFGAVLSVSEIAALVIILIEMIIGIFLMESLHITGMFPVIGSLDDRIRKRLFWTLLVMLFVLASVEAGLAFMREQISADTALLRQSLAGDAAAAAGAAVVDPMASYRFITLAAQMMIGFILPFVLMLIAIPLEMFFNSGRIVIAEIVILLVQGVAIALRIIGNIVKSAAEVIIAIYDVFIFFPLWIEEKIVNKGKAELSHQSESVAAEVEAEEKKPEKKRTRRRKTEKDPDNVNLGDDSMSSQQGA